MSASDVMKCYEWAEKARKMIAWGRRIGCRDAGHGFEPGRGVYTRLLVDDGNPQQHNFLMELVDNPVGLRAIDRAE